jgi:hypothetical protein
MAIELEQTFNSKGASLFYDEVLMLPLHGETSSSPAGIVPRDDQGFSLE